MKKSFVLFLTLAMLCAFTAASAQEISIYNGDAQFTINVTLPEDVQVLDNITAASYTLTDFAYLTEGSPLMVITVAPYAQYQGKSFADLTQDEMDMVLGTVTLEKAAPAVEARTTPEGYEYLVVNETTADNDVCDTVMLYEGYFIMVHVYYDNFSELTQQDIEIGPSIMDSLWIAGDTNG